MFTVSAEFIYWFRDINIPGRIGSDGNGQAARRERTLCRARSAHLEHFRDHEAWCWAKVESLTSDLSDRLQAETPSEVRQNLFTDTAKHSSTLVSRSTILHSEISTLQSELSALSNRQLHTDTMRAGYAIDHETVARGVVSNIRFDYLIDDLSSVDSKGLNYQDGEVLFHFNKQSPDIAGGVHVDKNDHDDGTGDQGMFDCASDETEDTAPLTHWITTRLGKKLGDACKNGDLRCVDSFIDAEAQVATHSFKRETDLGFYTRPVLETSGDECVPLKEVTDLFEADQGISVVHQRQTHTLQADNQEAVARQQQKHSNEQDARRRKTHGQKKQGGNEARHG